MSEFWSDGPSLPELDAYGCHADEYRQSTTACCPRETIPDSCSCPDGCECLCLDCECCRCPDCGRSDCTGEDCYWPEDAGLRYPADGEGITGLQWDNLGHGGAPVGEL